MGSRQLLTTCATEKQECKAFVKWSATHPLVGEHLAHIANEGQRNVIAGRSLKDIGMRRGFPDFILTVKNERYGALFIEMKRIFGSRKTKDQDKWINRLNKAGYYATYAYGWVDAMNITLAYLNNKI